MSSSEPHQRKEKNLFTDKIEANCISYQHLLNEETTTTERYACQGVLLLEGCEDFQAYSSEVGVRPASVCCEAGSRALVRTILTKSKVRTILTIIYLKEPPCSYQQLWHQQADNTFVFCALKLLLNMQSLNLGTSSAKSFFEDFLTIHMDT